MEGKPGLPLIAAGRDPSGPQEWQEATDLANCMLALVAARAYGLIEWDADVDTLRCEEILRRARRHNLCRPRDAAVVLRELIANGDLAAAPAPSARAPTRHR